MAGSEKDNLRGCPTFERGVTLLAAQQAGMDPLAVQAQITAPCFQ